MQAKLTLTRVHESFGEAGRRFHQQDSQLVAEESGGRVALSVREGARNSPDDAPAGMGSTPERLAAMALSRDEVKALVAFLSSLPDEA